MNQSVFFFGLRRAVTMLRKLEYSAVYCSPVLRPCDMMDDRTNDFRWFFEQRNSILLFDRIAIFMYRTD